MLVSLVGVLFLKTIDAKMIKKDSVFLRDDAISAMKMVSSANKLFFERIIKN